MATQKFQAQRAAAVTPSDTANIPNIAREDGTGNRGCLLYVGTAGDVRVTTSGGDTTTFVGIQGGQFLPLSVVRVLATGTTADNIIALW